MTTVISFGIQKGGSGKTTNTAITARILADEGYKVLCVDFDSQGSLTEVLTGNDPNEYTNNTIHEAIQEGSATNYIHVLEEGKIDYIAANKYLSLFDYSDGSYEALKHTLDTVKYGYDYVLIDLPPALGKLSINALIASDLVVIPAETARLAYTAIDQILETITTVQEKFNPNLKVAGILRSLNDVRRKDNKYYVELMKEKYPEITFDTIIKRTAAVGRIPDKGITDNDEIREVVRQHKEFIKELHKYDL